MANQVDHLSENQILFSMVDEKDLDEELQTHLELCPSCRKRKKRFQTELRRMSRMIRDSAPTPQEKQIFPAPKDRHFGFSLPVFAGALIAILAVAFIWFHDWRMGSSRRAAPSTSEWAANVPLVEDMGKESALPEYYLDMAASSYSYLDDEFMNFLVPLETEGNPV